MVEKEELEDKLDQAAGMGREHGLKERISCLVNA